MIIKINSRSEIPIYLQLRIRLSRGLARENLNKERYYLQCVRWRRTWE